MTCINPSRACSVDKGCSGNLYDNDDGAFHVVGKIPHVLRKDRGVYQEFEGLERHGIPIFILRMLRETDPLVWFMNVLYRVC